LCRRHRSAPGRSAGQAQAQADRVAAAGHNENGQLRQRRGHLVTTSVIDGSCRFDRRRILPQSGPQERRTVWAWGYNGSGELGDGTTTDRSMPVQVPGLTGVTAIALATGTAWPSRTRHGLGVGSGYGQHAGSGGRSYRCDRHRRRIDYSLASRRRHVWAWVTMAPASWATGLQPTVSRRFKW